MPVKPPPAKHKTEDSMATLTLSIPGFKHWIMSTFSGSMLVLWIYFDVTLIDSYMKNPAEFQSEGALMLLLIFILYNLLGVILIFSFIWQLFNNELVEITPRNIIIKRGFLGLFIPREYSAEMIRDLRATNSNATLGWTFNFYESRPELGSLAFDYGAKTYRFGSGIDEAEAKMIITEIRNKFPQYFNANAGS